MTNTNKNTSHELLNKAYKCKPADLESLLEEIDLAIKISDHTDKILFKG
jgi:hypothetical protein